MRSKQRASEPPPYHRNDKQNIRKRRKMENRSKHRDSAGYSVVPRLFDHGYAPPTGSNCYNRWAWLFRP